MKAGTSLIALTALFFGFCSSIKGQSCIVLDSQSDFQKSQLCSPVEVTQWKMTFIGVDDGGAPVEIRYDWDDGTTVTLPAAEGPDGTFTATATHTYISEGDRCNYSAEAVVIVNGEVCEASSVVTKVTVWDTDDENGGNVNASPNVYPVCIGNGATMRFNDNTRFNCVPPQEDDARNESTRWIQWVYGTDNTMSSSTPVSVDGYTGPWPYFGPVIELPGPIWSSGEVSLPITVADDNLVGEEFEVELRYWNYCNPYPSDPPETDRSVIRIVDLPDPTIAPIDTFCEFNPPVILSAATPGGTWSGPGIIDQANGEFAPYEAGPGTHLISYEVTDGNNCTASDDEDVFIRNAPAAVILPVDPFCIYDAPVSLVSNPSSGTWEGEGIVDSITGLFDPAVAGIGTHRVSFTTDPDPYGCVGVDSILIRVAGIPQAAILSEDTSWCELPDNRSTGRFLISGSDTSLFDLVLESGGVVDTIFNLPADTIELTLDNQVGRNEYILREVIEHHGSNACTNTINDTLAVTVHPLPEMDLTAVYDGLCSPVDVSFRAEDGNYLYFWRFGDGDSVVRTEPVVSHSYFYPIVSFSDTLRKKDAPSEQMGLQVGMDTTYSYRLIIETDFGCRDTVSDELTVHRNPNAFFVVLPEIQNYPDTSFLLTNLSNAGDWSYLWDFGDGNTDTIRDPLQYDYATYGTYEISLKTYSEFCADSTSETVQILPPPPIAGFQPDSIGCPPMDVTFRNTSEYADSYIWDFDDGFFSTSPSPTHTFFESKDHQVKMIAIGVSGTDTTYQTISIYESPQALFEVYPKEARNLKQVFKFVNNTVNGSYYLWDFGDGTTSPDVNASHVYGEEGTYDVTLYAWSVNDCPDTLVREQLISVIAGEGSVEFPNAFVWNGSGPTGGRWSENTIDNTVFHPNVINAVELHMIIYNRWGEKLFETNEVYVGWDGYLESGKLASPGVYVYKAWVTYIDGSEELITGDVTFLH